MTQYCWFSIICSSVTCVRTHTTLFVRNIHMLDINNKMNRLLSFKNYLVIVDTHLLLWSENALSFLMITFRIHNKLFLYINTQNKWKTTSLNYTLYIQDETTQHEPTQRERVFSTKPPSAKTWSAQNHPDSWGAFTFITIWSTKYIYTP